MGILVFVLLLMMGQAGAAEDSTAGPPATPCVTVLYAGQDIVCLRQGSGNFTAEERARTVEERINVAAKSPNFRAEDLRTRPKGEAAELLAGDAILVTLEVGDTEDGDVMKTAEVVAQRIAHAAEHERELRSGRAILRGGLFCLGATLFLVFVFFAFAGFFPKLYARIRDGEGRWIRSLKIQHIEILSARRMVEVLVWLAQSVRALLSIFVLYLYLPFCLSQFSWTANWAPKILSYILDPLHLIVVKAVDFVPDLFFLVVIFFATRFILRIVAFVFREIDRGTVRLEGFYREWAMPTYKLVRFFVFAFAFVMAFPYLPGSSSPAFRGVTVFLGLLLSLGSSSAVSNVVAGVVLTYMRPFTNGDRVKIADTVGDVIEKNLLVTRVRTIKNVDVTIPNSMVLSSHMVNYSANARGTGLILNATVTLGYDESWRRVHEILIAAALKTKSIMPEPKPFVLQTALNDFNVSYEINAYTRHPNEMAVIYSDLHRNIHELMSEAGIEIVSPSYLVVRDGSAKVLADAPSP